MLDWHILLEELIRKEREDIENRPVIRIPLPPPYLPTSADDEKKEPKRVIILDI